MGWKKKIKSYPTSFKTFVKDEVKHLAIKKKDIDYKKFSQDVF